MIEFVSADDGELLILELLVQSFSHLAVGTGVQTSPPDPTQTGLQQEIGRVLVLERFFVTEILGGPIVVDGRTYQQSDSPTNLLFLRFRFEGDEAAGSWSEMGLFGGGVAYTPQGATLHDGNQAGDDRAGRDVVLGGSYGGTESQTLTLTVSVAGASGIAEVSWISNGPEAPGSALVVFGTPVVLGTTGIAVTFLGGVDEVLTLGDAWQVRATIASDSPVFASGGVYQPSANPAGQVLHSGRMIKIGRIAPPLVKGASVEDVPMVVEVTLDG